MPPGKGLLRQASRITMLSLAPALSMIRTTAAGVDRLGRDVAGAGHPRRDRQQEIGAVPLHGVAGIVEQRLHAGPQPAGEGGHRRQRLAEVGVDHLDHLEAEAPERGRDRARVVGRVGELIEVLVAAVADHQGDALDRRRRPVLPRPACGTAAVAGSGAARTRISRRWISLRISVAAVCSSAASPVRTSARARS